ncbi:hypothetical protein DXK93_14880 [Achromobacter sp. K91]|nr:hypothetical protein DXK93_14880 [Achromobacter sp. K91]
MLGWEDLRRRKVRDELAARSSKRAFRAFLSELFKELRHVNERESILVFSSEGWIFEDSGKFN